MAQLFHHPVDPQSRFIRLVLSEMDVATDLIEEKPWERREAFLHLNPAGVLPVMIDATGLAVPGASLICEYLDEAYGDALGEQRLLPRDARARVETRRLIEWFSIKFHAEVSDYLITEKILKRFLPVTEGSSSPDTAAIRAAKSNVRYHLRYVGYLARRRNWLAGTGCPMLTSWRRRICPSWIIWATCRGTRIAPPRNGMHASSRAHPSVPCWPRRCEARPRLQPMRTWIFRSVREPGEAPVTFPGFVGRDHGASAGLNERCGS
jgi:glutathione S-transferase